MVFCFHSNANKDAFLKRVYIETLAQNLAFHSLKLFYTE